MRQIILRLALRHASSAPIKCLDWPPWLGLSSSKENRDERLGPRGVRRGEVRRQGHASLLRRFILGDSAVAATISLGHEDTFRAILSPESYVVVMPLGPTLALLMAPQGIAPVNVELADIVGAVNQLIWRWSDRYVAARDRDDLDRVWGSDAASRRSSVTATDGPEAAEAAGALWLAGLASRWTSHIWKGTGRRGSVAIAYSKSSHTRLRTVTWSSLQRVR
jgi:hypothetical protein